MIRLTPREYEVGTCLLKGYSNKEIADELQVTERTVKSHMKRLFNKFAIIGSVGGKRIKLAVLLKKNLDLKPLEPVTRDSVENK